MINEIKSYAKINLHLEVLNRRSDNYHNIFSLFAELEIHDLLKLEGFEPGDPAMGIQVEIESSGGAFAGIISGIPADMNLISKAVREYMNLAGMGGRFVFSIEKNIPSGAGLGGGSSNAAAALKLLDSAVGSLPRAEILKAAIKTGSDVPFFLFGGFSFVEGSGIPVTPLECSDNSSVLLVNNGIHVDTGFAYGLLGREVSGITPDSGASKRQIEDIIDKKSSWENLFRNDFEQSIFKLHPELLKIKEELRLYGAFFSAMSGSGSTIYGLFKNEQNADNAYLFLKNKGNAVYKTKFRQKNN